MQSARLRSRPKTLTAARPLEESALKGLICRTAKPSQDDEAEQLEPGECLPQVRSAAVAEAQRGRRPTRTKSNWQRSRKTFASSPAASRSSPRRSSPRAAAVRRSDHPEESAKTIRRIRRRHRQSLHQADQTSGSSSGENSNQTTQNRPSLKRTTAAGPRS